MRANKKKVLLTTLFLLCNIIVSIGQNVYPLHPSVGDTIDLNEKLDYSLFEKTKNTEFGPATIQFINNEFVLIFTYIDSATSLEIHTTVSISQEDIIAEQQKIQKINAYYKYLAEEEKNPKPKEYKVLEQKLPIRFDGPISEKIKKDARMKVRLVEDQRRMDEFQMGLRPREMILEFSR